MCWSSGWPTRARSAGWSRPSPTSFFTTPHYDGHPTVLVRFGGVDIDELKELLTESWRLRAPKKLLTQLST